MSRDEAALLDMLRAARRIRDFAVTIDEAKLTSDWQAQSIVLHQIMILGEAAKRVSDGSRELHSDVPWKKVAGMRDSLIHGYDRIRLDVVWNVATVDIPALIPVLERIAPKEAP